MSKKLILTDTEKAIYSMAFKEIQLKKKYNSPFRSDPDPSFEFFINNKSKRLWWHDWGTGEKGNCYSFLDRYNGEIKSRPITVKEERLINKEKIIKTKEFTIEELDFWGKFGIKPSTLDKFNVKSVETIDGKEKKMTFMFILKGGRYKIYSPLNKRKEWKFWGTMRASDVFGLEQLKYLKEEDLIITKSLKDVMVLDQMGYNAISFASESVIPSKTLIKMLKTKFKNVYILYDNDKQGRTASEKISEENGIKSIFLEIAKDISDCSEKHGFVAALFHLKKQIKNHEDKSIKNSRS